MAAIRSGNRVT